MPSQCSVTVSERFTDAPVAQRESEALIRACQKRTLDYVSVDGNLFQDHIFQGVEVIAFDGGAHCTRKSK